MTILFPPTLRPVDWARSHAQGDAPGATPYGLDQLSTAAVAMEYDHARPASDNPATWAGMGHRPAGGPRGSSNLALRRVLRQMDLVWCLSQGQLPLLRSWLDIDPERIAFLPFGIDTDFYAHRPWPHRPMVLSLGNDQDRAPCGADAFTADSTARN